MTIASVDRLPRAGLALAALTLTAALLWPIAAPAGNGDYGVSVPPADTSLPDGAQTDTAVLAGGCFWGMEEVCHTNGHKY